jgi:hypothetical protein
MDDGPIEPLLFHKAINILPQNKLLIKKAKEEQFDLNEMFIKVLKTNMHQLLFLEPLLYLRLVIIQSISNLNKLLYSGLFGGPNLNLNDPLQVWILNDKGGLIKIETCLSNCPKLDRLKKRYFCPQQSLSELIGLSSPHPDPTDYDSTIAFLSRNTINLEMSKSITVILITSLMAQFFGTILYALLFF